MPLLLKAPYGNTATDAFRFAQERGVLPTWMGSAEIRELAAEIRDRAVFSARTTHAVYLQELSDRIQRYLENGFNGDLAQLRIELKDILAELGYDPELGFPGDDALGIPPAAPGSLQDLSSDRRINLILDTQMQLMAGKGQEQRGLDPAALDLFPAWELLRIKSVRVPRDWLSRWEQAGGVILEDDGRKRMVALKTAEIWSLLGDPAIFPDALGVSHPPFAFSSGMGWDPIERDEWERLNPGADDNAAAALPANVIAMPPAVVSTSGLSPAALDRLKSTLSRADARDGKLTLGSSVDRALERARRTRGEINADLLLHLADVAELFTQR